MVPCAFAGCATARKGTSAVNLLGLGVASSDPRRTGRRCRAWSFKRRVRKISMDNLTCNSVLNNASDHCNQVLPPDQTASGPKPSICQRRQLPPKGPQSGFWPHGFLEARTIRFLKMCGFLALIPQASQRPLGQKTLRDPFDIRSFPFWPPGWGGGVPGLQNWFTALLSTRAYTMLGH